MIIILLLFDESGTYDIQSVSVLRSNESDVFHFTCTFIRGSQAQGCRLTTCQEVAMGNGTVKQTQCRNITILRDQNQSLSTQTVNGFGHAELYTIIQVVEIERDGSEITHQLIPELDISNVHTDPSLIVTTHISFPTDLNSEWGIMPHIETKITSICVNAGSPVNDGMLWPKHLTISVGKSNNYYYLYMYLVTKHDRGLTVIFTLQVLP